MARRGDQFIIILDIAAVFSSDEIALLKNGAAETAAST
jgi:hypothetical protein